MTDFQETDLHVTPDLTPAALKARKRATVTRWAFYAVAAATVAAIAYAVLPVPF